MEHKALANLTRTPAERLWQVHRLERTVANEWSAETKAPLVGALAASYLTVAE